MLLFAQTLNNVSALALGLGLTAVAHRCRQYLCQGTGIGMHARMGALLLPGLPVLLGVDLLNLLFLLVFARDLPENPHATAHHEHQKY